MSYHTPWADAHSTALTHHVLGGHLSYSGIAAAINGEFNTSYSRNACIGKSGRLGLINPFWQKMSVMPKRPKKQQPYKPRPKRPISVESHEYVELECSEIIPQHVSSVELAKNGCRWPYGDGPFTFCNHPQLGDFSYCGPHQRLSQRRNG